MRRRLCDIVLRTTVIAMFTLPMLGCGFLGYGSKPKPKAPEKKSNVWSNVALGLWLSQVGDPEDGPRYLRRNSAREKGEITPEEFKKRSDLQDNFDYYRDLKMGRSEEHTSELQSH